MRLENAECIQEYGASYIQSAWGSVLLVTSLNRTHSVLNNWTHGPLFDDMYWIHPKKDWNLEASIKGAESWTVWAPSQCDNRASSDPHCAVAHAPVEYCLAEYQSAHCTVRVSTTLLGIVIACNAIKIICMAVTAFAFGFQPLATIGDAISSFLDKPETLTDDVGILSFEDIEFDRWKDADLANERTRRPFKRWARRWGSAVRASRWCITILL